MKKLKAVLTAGIVLVFVVLVFIALFVPAPRRKSRSGIPAPAQPQEQTRTVAEMQTFFDTHFAPLLLETFPNRQYPIPEIQERYDTLAEMIRQRYGKEYALDPRGEYWPTSKQLTVAVQIANGTPAVFVLIPSVMDVLETGGKTEISAERLARVLLIFVVDFLHELDHLAHGFVPMEWSNPSVAERLDNERRAWAETCEHTIRPLLERHWLKIAPHHLALYQAWVAVGRNVDSPVWRSFIDEQYKGLPR